MSKATLFIEGRFRPGYERVFAEYSRRVRAYLEKHRGEVVRRQVVEQGLYGDDATKPDLVMLIDFPSRAIAQSIFFEQEYLDIIPLREQVFADFRMVLLREGEA